MDIDEITKLMLIGSISISILLVSFQLSRVLSRFADVIGDLRKSVKNIGAVTDQFVEDYESISKTIRSLSKTIDKINLNVLAPISKVSAIFGFLNRLRGGDSNKKED